MDEETKKRVAQFRFGVIHDLIGERRLNRGERKRLLREKSSSEWEIPGSGRSYISPSTILSWAARYRKSGGRIESLYPEERRDKGRPRVLDDDTVLALVELKKQLRGASLPSFTGKRSSEDPSSGKPGSYDHDLPALPGPGSYEAGRGPGGPAAVRGGASQRHLAIRRHARTQGPRGGEGEKTYLFAFIDDMSRLVCHGGFFLNEKVETYTTVLKIALKKRGFRESSMWTTVPPSGPITWDTPPPLWGSPSSIPSPTSPRGGEKSSGSSGPSGCSSLPPGPTGDPWRI